MCWTLYFSLCGVYCDYDRLPEPVQRGELVCDLLVHGLIV